MLKGLNPTSGTPNLLLFYCLSWFQDLLRRLSLLLQSLLNLPIVKDGEHWT